MLWPLQHIPVGRGKDKCWNGHTGEETELGRTGRARARDAAGRTAGAGRDSEGQAGTLQAGQVEQAGQSGTGKDRQGQSGTLQAGQAVQVRQRRTGRTIRDTAGSAGRVQARLQLLHPSPCPAQLPSLS